MMIQVSGDNAFIRAIIERYLQVQDTSPDKLDDLANEIVWLILKALIMNLGHQMLLICRIRTLPIVCLIAKSDCLQAV